MARLLSGGPAASRLSESLRARARALAERGVVPRLAVIRLGARDDDLAYERAAAARCRKIGVDFCSFALSADIPQDALLAAIHHLNDDPSIHGILVFCPLPGHIDEKAVCAAILPEKDVDGVNPLSQAAVYAGLNTGFAPCTAQSCLTLLRHYEIPLAGRRALVVGRSAVVGRPAAMLLLAADATVTVAHSRSRNLSELCRQADIVIAAAGKSELIGADALRSGQAVIDVGFHTLPDGRLTGDVRFDEAEPLVEAITPVPGGVGALTTAILCRHTIESAERVC